MRTLKWDIEDEEKRQFCLDAIIDITEDLQGREPGVIFANDVLARVLEIAGPDIYKKAINDAKKIVEAKMQDIDIDLDVLAG